MLTIKKKRRKPAYSAKDATALANASYDVLVETMRTSVVMAFEMPPEDGLTSMTIITAVSVVPNEFAERYANRVGDMHEELIDQFQEEYKMGKLKKKFKEVDRQV